MDLELLCFAFFFVFQPTSDMRDNVSPLYLSYIVSTKQTFSEII
jgi:hypothetical protein